MTFEYRDDHQLTLRINRLEPDYPGQTVAPAIWIETSDGFFSRTAVKVPADRVEEVVAGIRDAARTAARTCNCPHPVDEHSIYGCADDCACEWMPNRAARQTTGQDDTEATLRDRLRRAICEAEGFTWDTDMLEPDEYGDHADAVLQVLGEPLPERKEFTDPTTADDPTPLRWGLGDVMHGDDDSVIVCLSGPDREPYWLELDAERAAALRDDLTPPGDCPQCGDTGACNGGPCAHPTVGQPAEAHDTDEAEILARAASDLCAFGHGEAAAFLRDRIKALMGPGAWVPQYGRPLTPEEQDAETLAAADVVEDER